MVRDAIALVEKDESPVVVIDDATDLLEGGAGFALGELSQALRRHDGTLILSGGNSQARRAYGDVIDEVKSAKTGIFLQPDFDYDGDLLGATLVRPGGRSFPPGRGYLVIRGASSMVQVALPEGAPSS